MFLKFCRLSLFVSVGTFFLALPRLTFADPESGNDWTAAYHKKWHSSRAELALQMQALKGYQFLFVPGFLSSLFTRNSDRLLPRSIGLPQYFTEQVRWLLLNGFDAERIPIFSQQSLEENAAVIRYVLDFSNRPIILIAHSKGAVDALFALIHNPRLRSKVKIFITLQGAIYGSPIADMVLREDLLNQWSGFILKQMGGSIASLQSLRTSDRAQFMNDYQFVISQILQSIPTITVESTTGKAWPINSLLFMTKNLLLKAGYQNDGLMPLSYGSFRSLREHSIILDDLDHADLVMPSIFRRYDRVKQMQVLCSLALERLIR